MQHRLSISFDNQGLWEVQAETNLGPSPQLESPEIVIGKLLELTTTRLLELKAAVATRDVEVAFESRTYKFSGLDESNGTYELILVM
jgi:hypothetical protein